MYNISGTCLFDNQGIGQEHAAPASLIVPADNAQDRQCAAEVSW